MEDQNNQSENVKVTVIPGGPLMITGTCEVTHANGTVETRENRSTYCRCGVSGNKPFCDGSHKSIEWKS
jgi:CDGSH-type Zn-finger protein